MRSIIGWFGEKKTIFNLWWTLDAKVYRRVNNVILPSKNGTVQIDHLLISPYGVFIVETKNIKGWIFGSHDQAKWTQVVFGNKYQFQNPIRQTFRQKRVLSEYLGLNENYIYPVIYFVGGCRFKTNLPSNVINSGLSSHIKQYQHLVLSLEEITLIQRNINDAKSNPLLTTSNHIRSLQERYSSTSVCPKCGSKLVEKVARKGLTPGSKFLGCENYPRCRFTRNCD